MGLVYLIGSPKSSGGGGVNGANVVQSLQYAHGIDIFFHLKYINVLQISSSLVTRGSSKGLSCFTNTAKKKKKKRQKRSQKVEKSEFAFSRKKTLL